MFPFRRRHAFRLIAAAFAGVLLWPVCVHRAAGEDSGNGILETFIAEASAQSPRNSEGDIVVLRDGSLLAAWTEFYGGARDDSSARISAKRSHDGGKTWGERFTLRENSGKLNVMSASFLRTEQGELLLFYLEKNSRSDLNALVVRSNDEGRTWSEPVLITPEKGYFVMNNARVVQLADDRIVAPLAFTDEVWKKGHTFKTVCYFSDDHGRTWTRGKGQCTAPKRGAMEPGLIQRSDGSVLQLIRTQMGTQWFATSTDGCDTWTEATPGTIVSPEAPATVARLPDDAGWIVVHNPTIDPANSHNGKRTPLVAAVSVDEGRHWLPSQSIESNPDDTYAYTSLDFHAGRVLMTYYVRHGADSGDRAGRLSWKFKSIPLEWFIP